MHCVVCVKQVPDSSQIRVHPVTNTIMRQGVPTILNPFDAFALEAAMRVRDAFGGKVTVITMGPATASEVLTKALSHGADEVILLTDMMFAGSDTLATAKVLAHAVRKLGEREPVDLVFCGKQSIDGDTGQVGPGLAWRLGMQQLTYVTEIEQIDIAARTITVARNTEQGTQIVRTRLPALLTILETAPAIRFGSMDDAFRAAEAEVPRWKASDIDLVDAETVGLKGSPTKVKKVFAPTPRTERARMIATEGLAPRAVADAILDRLFADQPQLLEALRTARAERAREGAR